MAGVLQRVLNLVIHLSFLLMPLFSRSLLLGTLLHTGDSVTDVSARFAP